MKNLYLPAKIAAEVGKRLFYPDKIGESSSAVLLSDDLVLKISPKNEESLNEVAVLLFLRGKLPVPDVIGWECEGEKVYLLTSRVKGEMACAPRYRRHPEELIFALADILKRMWSVDVAGLSACTLERRLSLAEQRVRSGQVESGNTEPQTWREFSTPARLLDWLQKNRPKEEELVFSHGDFCLPNILLKDYGLSGLIDLGLGGVAEKWSDLALLWRSLRDNFGGKFGGRMARIHPDRLFDALGFAPDREKIRYYLLLDELF